MKTVFMVKLEYKSSILWVNDIGASHN
jgi:hypothetical protein